MSAEIARLGTVASSVDLQEHRTKWFRSEITTRTIKFLDWTIDGRPLREIVRYQDGLPSDTTGMRGDWPAEYTRQSLAVLLDVSAGGPEVRMDDGRIALLYCLACGDLGCGALTAQVVTGPETVEWRDIGWQNDYEPFDPSGQDLPIFTVTFNRAQYEATIGALLRRDTFG